MIQRREPRLRHFKTYKSLLSQKSKKTLRWEENARNFVQGKKYHNFFVHSMRVLNINGNPL